MTDERNGRLVILSGPSCVGKSPLANALALSGHAKTH
jgi:guanylate kinase